MATIVKSELASLDFVVNRFLWRCLELVIRMLWDSVNPALVSACRVYMLWSNRVKTFDVKCAIGGRQLRQLRHFFFFSLVLFMCYISIKFWWMKMCDRQKKQTDQTIYFSTAWSICLSVVCHTRAPCLHRSTDLSFRCHPSVGSNDTLCQSVRWGYLTGWPPGRPLSRIFF